MLELTKKPPIEELKLIGPADLIQQVAEYDSLEHESVPERYMQFQRNSP